MSLYVLSAVGLKICESLQELKSISQLWKTRGKKHEKVLLGKAELDTMEVLISKALIDSCINHDELFWD